MTPLRSARSTRSGQWQSIALRNRDGTSLPLAVRGSIFWILNSRILNSPLSLRLRRPVFFALSAVNAVGLLSETAKNTRNAIDAVDSALRFLSLSSVQILWLDFSCPIIGVDSRNSVQLPSFAVFPFGLNISLRHSALCFLSAKIPWNDARTLVAKAS